MDGEAEVIVKDFTSILEELSFNSRPIITTLTKIAEENISCAQYFVDALEARIEKCVPKQKLYAFYALDSICKNAGSPYTIYFSRNLFTLYKKTYLLVDNTTRTKLISMFKTWIAPNDSIGSSSPLFEKTALDKIESFLIKASALHQKNFQNMLPKPTVPLLLREIDKLTSLTNERLRDQPNDDKLQMKLLVLNQLKQELQKEKLTAAALKQVQMQLMQVFSQDQQVLQEKLKYEKYQEEQQRVQQEQQQPQLYSNSSLLEDGNADNRTKMPLFGDNSKSNGPTSSLFGNFSSILAPPDFAEIEKSNNLTRVQNLYNSLDSEGLLYKAEKESIVALDVRLNGGSKNANNESINLQNQNQKALPSLPLLQNILADCKAYFATANVDLLNNSSLQLSQQTILNDNPIVSNNLVHLLYRVKPKKCNICGKRFGNSLEERRLQSDHLDWHFRINKRMKGSENANVNSNNTANSNMTSTTQKNIQSRNWYLHDSQWVTFKDDEIISTNSSLDDNVSVTMANLDAHITSGSIIPGGISSGSSNSNNRASGEGIINIDESVLRKKFVVVPESSEDMSFQCPICKETVTAVYDEELGEWAWKNAIEYNDKYYHATCYYEAAKNSDNSIGLELDLEKLKNLISE